jgi:hypothetical protein
MPLTLEAQFQFPMFNTPLSFPSRLLHFCIAPNLLNFYSSSELRRAACSALVWWQLDIRRDLSHTNIAAAIPGLDLFLTAALKFPLALAVTIAVDVLGGGRGLEFRVDGCDLRCASLATSAAAAASSALPAARAFALVACGGVDTTTGGAVAGLSSAAATSSRGGFGFDGLLLGVRDLFGGRVTRVEIEACECGVVAFKMGLFSFVLFIFAHSADSYMDEDHGVGRFGVW